METQFNYATISEAITALKAKGYAAEFKIGENGITSSGKGFSGLEFEIAAIYRYEGNSDPADEATVYAIESSNGLKGILVTGYGAYSDAEDGAVLRKLRLRNK